MTRLTRRRAGERPIVLGALVMLCIGLLGQCADTAARPARATLPGNATISFVEPAPVDCDAPGWSVFYVATGTVYRVASWSVDLDTLHVRLQRASELRCIYADSFEGGASQ